MVKIWSVEVQSGTIVREEKKVAFPTFGYDGTKGTNNTAGPRRVVTPLGVKLSEM